MWGDIAIAFTIAFVTSFMATPYTIRFAKKQVQWTYHKILEELTKLLCLDFGGLAVILGCFVSVIYLLIVMTIEKNIDIKI